MPNPFAAAAALAVLAVAGCAQFSTQPPVAVSTTVSGAPTNTEPEPPNSLPLGSQVLAPLTPPEGNISRTVATLPFGPYATPLRPGDIPAIPSPSP